MPLTPLKFRPGLVRDVPAYSSKGGWFDCNLIRFRLGFPESMGGWQRVFNDQYQGTIRSMHVWFNLQNARRMGIGSHLKFYLETGNAYYDITPIRRSVTLGADPFAITSGSNILTVTDTGHGATDNAFVTFSSATGAGNVTAGVLNTEHQIATIVDGDTYTIVLPVTANTTDASFGGTPAADYQINPGLDTQLGGAGWGAGAWNTETWGAEFGFNVEQVLRLWTQDNFGEDLIFNVRDGGVFYWDNSSGLTARGVALEDLVGADSTTPTIARQVMVSDRDRHVIAFGANQGGSTAQDPMIIRFSDQEDPLTWTPTATNTAGDLRLGSGSRIIRAIETKREILVWTDAAMYSMKFIGPPFTFGIEQVSSAITTIGFNSYVAVEDNVFWMGRNTFFVYSGQVQELPCPVKEYVFDNINQAQLDKVFAGSNVEFSEVIWFYPSSGSDENNRYVIYNYQDNAWYFGELARTAWMDCCPEPFPVAAGTDNRLYYHESGANDGSTIPPTPLNPYIESSPIDITEGENLMFISRFIPDVTFINSETVPGLGTQPRVDMTLQAQNFPGSALGNTQNALTVRQAAFPVEQFTGQVHIRLRGRSVRLRVESNQLNTRWILGTPRIDLRPDGRR